jgi:hypothetical protein
MALTLSTVSENDLRKNIMNKLNLSEETLNKINQLNAGGNVGISKPIDLQMPIVNGYGQQNLGNFTNPFPWSVTASATMKIVSPPNGTWRIRVTVGGKVVFDQSGINPNQTISANVSIPGWSTVAVIVEAWWSTSGNTTLHATGTINV